MPPLVSAINECRPPTGMPGVEDVCKDSCCWRWLTTMLVEELHLIKRKLAETREAFVEQERAFLVLENSPESEAEAYAEIARLHKELREEHSQLRHAFPMVSRDATQLADQVKLQRDEVAGLQKEISGLQEQLREEDLGIVSLQERLEVARGERRTTATRALRLQEELEEVTAKSLKQRALVDMMLTDRDAYRLQYDFLSHANRMASQRKAQAQAAFQSKSRGGTGAKKGKDEEDGLGAMPSMAPKDPFAGWVPRTGRRLSSAYIGRPRPPTLSGPLLAVQSVPQRDRRDSVSSEGSYSSASSKGSSGGSSGPRDRRDSVASLTSEMVTMANAPQDHGGPSSGSFQSGTIAESANMQDLRPRASSIGSDGGRGPGG